METYEKDILKREITIEVKENLSRAAGKLITRRILLAFGIISLELFIWALITTSVVKDASVAQGLWTSLLVCWIRISEAWAISWFCEK